MAKPVTHQYLVEEFGIFNPSSWKLSLHQRHAVRMSVIVAEMLGRIEAGLRIDLTEDKKIRLAMLDIEIDARHRAKIDNLIDPNRVIDKSGTTAGNKRDRPPYNSYGFLSVQDGSAPDKIRVTVRLIERFATDDLDRKGNPRIKKEALAVTTGLQQLIQSYLEPEGLDWLTAEMRAGVAQEIGQEVMSHLQLLDSGEVEEANFPTREERDPNLRRQSFAAALERASRRTTAFNRVPYPELYPARFARISQTNPELAEKLKSRLLVVDDDWDTVRRTPEPPSFPLFFVTSGACQVFYGEKQIASDVAKADRHRGITGSADASAQARSALQRALKLFNQWERLRKKAKASKDDHQRQLYDQMNEKQAQALNLLAPYGLKKPRDGFHKLRQDIKRLLAQAENDQAPFAAMQTNASRGLHVKLKKSGEAVKRSTGGKDTVTARKYFLAVPLINPDVAEQVKACPALNGGQQHTGRGWNFNLRSLSMWGEEPYRPHTGKRKAISHRVLFELECSRGQRERVLLNKNVIPCWSRLVFRDGRLFWQLTYKVELAPEPETNQVLGIHFGPDHLFWTLLAPDGSAEQSGSIQAGGHLKRHIQTAHNRSMQQKRGKWIGGKKSRKALRTETFKVIGQIIALAKRLNARICVEDIAFVEKQRGSVEANRIFSGWNFAQLKRFLEYKAPLLGCGQLLTCSDYIVNLTCPECGSIRQAKQKQDNADTFLERKTGVLSCRKCEFSGVVEGTVKALMVARHGQKVLQRQ